MKKALNLTILLAATSLFNALIAQQTVPYSQTVPHIEVVGTAEEYVVPDEIYLTIELEEKEDKKENNNLDRQESRMKQVISRLKIPLENLQLANAAADEIRIKRRKYSTLSRVVYSLKLSTAEEVSQVLDGLDESGIDNVHISHVTHSNLVELQQKNRIAAIKAAKFKADYLLEAIGEKTGMAILVEEMQPISLSRSMVANTMLREEENLQMTSGLKGSTVQFRKIRLSSSVKVIFSIAKQYQ